MLCAHKTNNIENIGTAILEYSIGIRVPWVPTHFTAVDRTQFIRRTHQSGDVGPNTIIASTAVNLLRIGL